jgi:hypothetical protein
MGIKNAISVSPNPVTDDVLYLDIEAASRQLQVQVLDAQGRLLRGWLLDTEGQTRFPLNIGDLPTGMLFLRVKNETLRIVR